MDVDLGLLEPGDFPEVYGILEESFPVEETRPYQEAKELINTRPQLSVESSSMNAWALS